MSKLVIFPLGLSEKGKELGRDDMMKDDHERKNKGIFSNSNSLGHKEGGCLKSHWTLERRMPEGWMRL